MWLENFGLGVMVSDESLESLDFVSGMYLKNRNIYNSDNELYFRNRVILRKILSTVVLYQSMFESLLNYCIINNKNIKDEIFKIKTKKDNFSYMDKVKFFIKKSDPEHTRYLKSYKNIYNIRNGIVHSKNEKDLENIEGIDFKKLFIDYKNSWFLYLIILEKSGRIPDFNDYEDNWTYLIRGYRNIEEFNKII